MRVALASCSSSRRRARSAQGAARSAVRAEVFQRSRCVCRSALWIELTPPGVEPPTPRVEPPPPRVECPPPGVERPRVEWPPAEAGSGGQRSGLGVGAEVRFGANVSVREVSLRDAISVASTGGGACMRGEPSVSAFS